MQLLENLINNNNVKLLIDNISIDNLIKEDINNIIINDSHIIKENLNCFITESNLIKDYNLISNFVENDVKLYLETVSFILSNKLSQEQINSIFISEGLLSGLKEQWKKDRKLNKFVKTLEKEIAQLDEEFIKTTDQQRKHQILNKIKSLEDETRTILGPKWVSILSAILGASAQLILVYFGAIPPTPGFGIGNALPGAVLGYGARKTYSYLKRFLARPYIKNQVSNKQSYSGYSV